MPEFPETDPLAHPGSPIPPALKGWLIGSQHGDVPKNRVIYSSTPAEPGTPTAWWKESDDAKMRLFDRVRDHDPVIQALLNTMDNRVKVDTGQAFWQRANLAPNPGLYAHADDPNIKPGQIAVWDWGSPTDRASVNARLYPDVARVAKDTLDKQPAPGAAPQCADLPDSWRRYPGPGPRRTLWDFQGLAVNTLEKARLEDMGIDPQAFAEYAADAALPVYSHPSIPRGHVYAVQGEPPAGSTLMPMPEARPYPEPAPAPESTTDAYDESPELPEAAKVFLVECQLWGDLEWSADAAFRTKAGAVAYVDTQRRTLQESDRPFRITAMKLED